MEHHYYFLVTNTSLGKISEKHNKKSHGLTEYGKWENLKLIWNTTMSVVKKNFKGVPIIPTFGNNDFLRNYAPPISPVKSETNYFVMYPYLYDLWLKDNE